MKNNIVAATNEVLSAIDDALLASSQFSMKLKVERLLESAAPSLTGVTWVWSESLTGYGEDRWVRGRGWDPECSEPDCPCGEDFPKDCMGLTAPTPAEYLPINDHMVKVMANNAEKYREYRDTAMAHLKEVRQYEVFMGIRDWPGHYG